jgi:ribonucleotide reductase alpha subunit
LKKYGIRHSTLTANAPYGNSAETSGSTSGMEPPRKLLSIKEDKKRYIKKLYSLNIPIEKIAEITEMCIEDVKKIVK